MVAHVGIGLEVTMIGTWMTDMIEGTMLIGSAMTADMRVVIDTLVTGTLLVVIAWATGMGVLTATLRMAMAKKEGLTEMWVTDMKLEGQHDMREETTEIEQDLMIALEGEAGRLPLTVTEMNKHIHVEF